MIRFLLVSRMFFCNFCNFSSMTCSHRIFNTVLTTCHLGKIVRKVVCLTVHVQLLLMCFMLAESPYRSCNFIHQQKFLNKLLKEIKSNPNKVILIDLIDIICPQIQDGNCRLITVYYTIVFNETFETYFVLVYFLIRSSPSCLNCGKN
jgi:hypothetical protein